MATDRNLIEEQAIAWTIAARDVDFDDWDALTAWLEADATHAEAFERMTMLDDMLPELLPSRPVIVRHEVQPRRWSFARLGAVAAAIVAVIGLSFLSLRYLPYSIETGAGERQTIALADGSTIELNGDTKITLSKSYPRHAELERGEALFTVVHNDRDPFVVEVGGAVVEDAGTVFNVIRSGDSTEVGVSEGLVIYNPQKERVALKPGQALRAFDGKMRAETFAVPLSAVGGWKRNQLTYNAASMDRIAADLSRSLGRRIIASAEVRSMRFTGTINVQKDADRFVAETAPVLGVGVRRTEDGWMLVEGDEAIR
jgi:transmembrane sensor